MKKSFPLLLLLAPVLLSGCSPSSLRSITEALGTVQRASFDSAPDDGKVGSLEPDAQAAARILAQKPASLPAVKSGAPGVAVAVFEPQTSASPRDTAFGKGCGRWLQLQVAGLPELGGSPTWHEWDYALREQGLENAAPSQQQAFAAGKALALTHMATGKLEGEGNEKTLIYQLWKLPELKPVGAPLRARGDRQEIVTALPGMARTLAGRLGASQGLPTRIELYSGELMELGKLPRLLHEPVHKTQLEYVQKLAQGSALAATVVLAHASESYKERQNYRRSQALDQAAQQLAQLAGTNSLALAQVSAARAGQLPSSPYWKALAAKYPRNYALASMQANWHRDRKNRPEQKTAARAMLATAPKNAWAWLAWDEVLADEAEDIRQSRSTNKMSQNEFALVEKIYPQMVDACLKALQCDPKNAYAWLRLSRASAFAGDAETADIAYRQAMSLPTRGMTEHLWGLNLYQPKWQNNPGKLRRVAQLISNQSPLFVRTYVSVVQALQNAGLARDAKRYEDEAAQALEQWLKHSPDDLSVGADYASILDYRGNLEGSANQAQLLMRRFPDEAEGYLEMGKYYEEISDWASAAEVFEEGLQRDPNSFTGLYGRGQALHQLGQYAQAEVLYHKAIKLHPQKADPYNRLADLHRFVKNDLREAERLYRKAIELDPSVELYHQNLQRCLAAG